MQVFRVTVSQTLYNFFSTELGLLIFGSIVIPFMFGLYARYNKGLDEKLKRNLLTRIIIYRYGLIDDACCELDFKEALNTIKGVTDDGKHSYTPMANEYEEKTNIYGLIMRALNEKELSKTAIPESVSNLSVLSNMLENFLENSDDKKDIDKYCADDQKGIHDLVSILNELILDKESFKEYLYTYQSNPLVILLNFIRKWMLRYQIYVASLNASTFASSIGDLCYSKIYLKKKDIRTGLHFSKRKKFYYDKLLGFRISFPSEDWSYSNQILKKCLQKKIEDKKTQIAFVLIHRGIHDFYWENIHVLVREGNFINFKQSLEDHIKNFKDFKVEKIYIDEKSATIEFKPVTIKGKTYIRFQRFIMEFNKIYIITATFEKENLKHLKNDLVKILNSFKLIN